MARSLKISFPLPRRLSSSPHTTPGSQYSSQSNVDDSPISHPGPKAERVLGASEVDAPELKKKQSKKARRQIRKYPSFMSVTLSDVDAESVKTLDEFPFPGMHSSEMMPHPRQDKSRQGSSPLLEEQYTFASTRSALNNSSSPQARRTGSSSTIRSHYDPKKSPLSISQQTSASSARDMALRKGFPPVSGPSRLGTIKTIRYAEPDGLHSRNMSTNSKISGSSKLSGNSIKRINNFPRRRPSVMDPPTLYPNSNRAFYAVSPPSALIHAALPKPLGPQSQRKPSFSRPSWWAKVKTQSPPPIESEDQQYLEGFDDYLPSFKLNVKKPKAQPEAGMRNWFDGLGDEAAESDDHQGINISLHEPHMPPLAVQEIMTKRARSPQIPERNRYLGNHKEPITLSDRKPSFGFDSSPIGRLYSGFSSKALDDMNTGENPHAFPDATAVQASVRSKGVHPGVDLQLVSFLELSSSEDETESSSDAPYRRHRIRASIEKASYNNEVSVGNAQRAQPARPRSIINGRTRSLARRSNGSEKVPPVPKIPDKPRLSQRTASVRWREVMEDKVESVESTLDDSESSLSGSIDTRRATTRANQTIRRSRFMKVTSEEEKLLEAMREKRASIRQDDFDKGFKTAMQLQDIVARPRTAGADGRASQSPNFGFRSSTSPPPQEYAFKISGTDPQFSASAEDLRLEEAYPFPKVPLNRIGYISPSKASPSLSFSPSDVLPGTPASHNSPITPPPAHGGLGAYGRNLALSAPRGTTAINNISHEREKTFSSGVVDVDGVEPQAPAMDENELPRWALDRW